MKTSLWNALLQTPSARSLVTRIVDGLANQVSQVLLLPETVQQDVVHDSVLSEAMRRDFTVGDVHLDPEPELTAGAFAKLIRGLADVDIREPFDLSDVLPHPRLPEVVFLNGVEGLSARSQRTLMEILAEWSRISQSAQGQQEHCPTACCVSIASEALWDSACTEVHLNVEWWWGFPSMLETAMLCRETVGEFRADADSVWRESLAPSLCAGDMTLVGAIWSVLPLAKSHLWRRIREYGECLGWDRETILNALAALRASRENGRDNDWQTTLSSYPPDAYRASWGKGMVHFSPEVGVELHPAALALVGQSEALEHRLWRAQAALMLPRLDMVRHGICQQLAHRHGTGWPTRWARPNSEEEIEQLRRSHLACQWGYLEHLLRTCPQFRGQRSLLPLVCSCRKIRNELAHYRPVEFAEFREIWKDMSPVTEMLS